MPRLAHPVQTQMSVRARRLAKTAGYEEGQAMFDDMAGASSDAPQPRHQNRTYSHYGDVYDRSRFNPVRTRWDGKVDGGVYVTRTGSHGGSGRYSYPQVLNEPASKWEAQGGRRRDVSSEDDQARGAREMMAHVFNGNPLGSYITVDADKVVDPTNPDLPKRYPVDAQSLPGTFSNMASVGPDATSDDIAEARENDGRLVDWNKAAEDGVGMAEVSFKDPAGNFHPSEGMILNPDAVTGSRPMYGYQFRPMKYSYRQYPWMGTLMKWLNGVDSPEAAAQRGEDMRWAWANIMRTRGASEDYIDSVMSRNRYPNLPVRTGFIPLIAEWARRNGRTDDADRAAKVQRYLEMKDPGRERYLERRRSR